MANLTRGKRFSSSDGSARKASERGHASQSAWKSISEIITTKLDEEDGKLKEALGMRVLKMALEGNLPAIQYVVKLIGEEPAQELNVSTGNFDALDEAFKGLGQK